MDGTKDRDESESHESIPRQCYLSDGLSSPDSGSKRREIGPKLNLTLHKVQGRQKTSLQGIFPCCPPISPCDVQALILYALLGPQVGVKPRWCSLRPWRTISQGIVVHVNIAKDVFVKHATCFPYMNAHFLRRVDVDRGDALKQLFCVPVHPATMLRERLERERKNASLVSGGTALALVTECNSSATTGDIGRPKRTGTSRLDCLMPMLDMIYDQYPSPSASRAKDAFMYSKDFYYKTSERSPIFAIDCEMCMTDDEGHELTRISVVDEHFNVLYDTLVKPENRIINYLTKFSGITEDMLVDVTTRLADVQKYLRDNLPPDAIWCGHSLNFDLRALKLYHPYVIDLSVLYNLSGDRHLKSSLQTLAETFLGETIQNSKRGHCSVEDAVITMRLLRLKLEQGLDFGNVALGWKYEHYANKQKMAVGCSVVVESNGEPATKKARIEKKTVRAMPVCGGCDTELSHQCRNNTCACRALMHKSCIKCPAASSSTHDCEELRTRIETADAFQVAAGRTEDLFTFMRRNDKKISWITKSPCAENLCPLPDFCKPAGLHHHHAQSNAEAVQLLKQRLLEFDLAVVTLLINDLNSCPMLSEIDELVREVYAGAPKHALMCVLFSDERSKRSCGQCCVKIKYPER